MKNLLIAFIFVFAGFAYAQPTETPTPLPKPMGFADFTDDNQVGVGDLMELFRGWHETATVPGGDFGDITGSVTMNDGCGTCLPVPEDLELWAFADAGQRRLTTRVETDGTFRFEHVPVGTYTISIDDRNSDDQYIGRFQTTPLSVVAGENNVGEYCVYQDIGARCGGNCPVDRWFAYFVTVDGEMSGFVDLNSDGTLHGDMTLDADDPLVHALVAMDGTYSMGAGCEFTFSANISPRDGGGDCQVTGTIDGTLGYVANYCTEITDGYWESNLNLGSCGGTSIDAGYFYFITNYEGSSPPASSEQLDFTSILVPAAQTQGDKDATNEDYDLNFDGKINHGDLLLLVEQWGVQFPTGPTCTPLPECTPTSTEEIGPTDDGTPDPTPTFDPATLEGWWRMYWDFDEPFDASFPTENNLGDPGAGGDVNVDLGDFFENVTGTYTYEDSTGQFVMTLSGQASGAGFSGDFTMQCSGTVSSDGLHIENGSITGQIQGVVQDRDIVGTFTAHKCCVVVDPVPGWDCDCNDPNVRR